MAIKSLFSLDSYSRITSNKNFIPEIDGLRFIAIITVLLLHLTTNYVREFSGNFSQEFSQSFFYSILYTGGWGVQLFFSISGFILSIPFIKFARNNSENLNIRSYFFRRVSRLEPPFFISLSLIYLANLFFSFYSFYDSFPHFLATLFYCHVFIYGTWSNINPISWSLETEVQFYILAPLLIFLFKLKQKWLIRLIIIILFLLSNFVTGSNLLKLYHLHTSVIPYFQSFAVGILVADLYLNYKHWFSKQNILFDLFAWIGIPLIYLSKIYFTDFLFNVLVFFFFISVFKCISFKHLINNKLITTIGGMCYTIYLFHYALIFILMKAIKLIPLSYNIYHLILSFFICIICVLVFSFLFFKFFERPFMDKNYINNLTKKLFSKK